MVKIDITDICGVKWTSSGSWANRENLLLRHRVRKWIEERMGPEIHSGWEVEFERNNQLFERPVTVTVTLEDDLTHLAFKLAFL